MDQSYRLHVDIELGSETVSKEREGGKVSNRIR